MSESGRSTAEDRKADGRKQAVSIRMGRGEVRQVKRLAKRLGVRDSDVIRFAIKLMLVKLAPLPDPMMAGRALVPVFMASGPELVRHFDLDAECLESIINDGAGEGQRVAAQDIQLLALRCLQGYHFAKPGLPDGLDTTTRERSLQHYLYEKYSVTPTAEPEQQAVSA